MWWNDYAWDYFPWPIMPLMMMAFFALCATMMFLMMRRGHHGADRHALAILQERFARGEINQAEFEERRRILQA